MGFREFWGSLKKAEIVEKGSGNVLAWDTRIDAAFKRLAYETGVRMISSMIQKCVFQTYKKGEKCSDRNFYAWNVSPNRNQNAAVFLDKIIHQLFYSPGGECLVITTRSGEMLVADSFTKEEFALKDYKFTNVTVEGYTFPEIYYSRDVLFFELNDENLKDYLEDFYSAYGEPLSLTLQNYKQSQGTKGIIEIDAAKLTGEKGKESYETRLNSSLKKYFSSINGVMTLFRGTSYRESKRDNVAGNSRDVRAIIDDVYDMTARILLIPPSLMRGEHANTEVAVKNFLTFCIDSLTRKLSQEINRKQYSVGEYLEGTKMIVDTSCLIHIDVLSAASAIDKLISSGNFCINEIRALLGLPPINEEWAWKHFITKNYTSMDALEDLEGGEKHER